MFLYFFSGKKDSAYEKQVKPVLKYCQESTMYESELLNFALLFLLVGILKTLTLYITSGSN